jgi:hypothetical protein
MIRLRYVFALLSVWMIASQFVMAQTPVETAEAEPKPAEPAPASPATVDSDIPKEQAATTSDTETKASQALVLVVGSGGTPEYSAEFSKWAARWTEASKNAQAETVVIGLDAGSTTPVTSIASAASPRATSSSTTDADALSSGIQKFATIETSEPLWLVYLGHGTFDGRKASLNLRGPDVTEERLSELLKESKRPVVGIFCCSCSSPFVNALSGPNRIIISATKDGNQIQYSRFGDAFSTAIGSLDADINRDGQVSLLEAWLFASRRTSEFYKTEGRLATEHSLLDDNGDQKGTRAENFEGLRLKPNIKNAAEMDGKLSARWSFVRSDDERKLTPEQRKTRDDLESQLEALREQKDSMDEAVYLFRLEEILRPLAELYEGSSSVPAESPAPAN